MRIARTVTMKRTSPMAIAPTTDAVAALLNVDPNLSHGDLRRIESNAITAHMESLCQQEAATIDSGNLWTIAREADGSMRDALSLLDQVQSSTQGRIDEDKVADVLGLGAGFSLGLDVDLPDATEAVEVVDEGAAHEGLQGLVDGFELDSLLE